MQLSGWWRLFIIFGIAWGLVSAYLVINKQAAELASAVFSRNEAYRAACAKLATKLSDADVQECWRAMFIRPDDQPWTHSVRFGLLWLGPLAILVVVVAAGRWVTRGFRSSRPPAL